MAGWQSGESGMVERLYGALGQRYALAFYGWISVVAFTTGLMTLLAAVPYLDAGWAQISELAPAWGVSNGGALLTVVLLSRNRFRPAFDWLSGERSADVAPVAWVSFVADVSGFLLLAVGVFSAWSIPAAVLAAGALDLPWYGAIIIAFAVEITIVVAALLDYLGIELLSRPVLREMAAYLPPGFEPPRAAPSVRWRVVAGMTITSLYGVGLGTAIGATTLAPAVKLAVGLGFALTMTSTLVLFIASLLSDAVVVPMRDLVNGMRRVRTGELGVRVPVLTGDEVGSLAVSFNDMAAGLAEREVLRSAMGMYVAPSVAERFLTEGTTLAGEELVVTVMFLDIRDFTKIADGQRPEETVSMLNEFFEMAVPLVEANGGHTNKYLGDGFLAVFGAPTPLEDHADRALRAGMQIAAAVRARYADSLRVGVGLNSGSVVVGSVGGGGRLEYSLIGDTVNVASRVESLTKELGETMLLTDATRRLLARGHPRLSRRGEVPVRGKASSLRVHAPAALTRPRGRRTPE